MLKSVLVVSLSFVALSSAAAQHEHAPAKVEKDKPAAGHSMEHMSGWKELDAYHMVMMGAWHPAKEKNDLAPVRQLAAKLSEASEAWSKAAIPPACDTPDNRSGIARIQADSRALAALVAKGTDEEVKAALKNLHDRFEVVNRSCKAHH